MAGSYVTGTLYVWTAPEGSRKPGYHVQVEARARFKKHGVQVDKNINICILGGGPFGSYGLGIYDVSLTPLTLAVEPDTWHVAARYQSS